MHRVIIDRAEPLRHLATEWLLTNGLGGFAMGTALGASTRRYHGLLVGALKPPLGRVVALHSVIEQLVTPDGPIDLAMPIFDVRKPNGEGELDNELPPGKRCHLLRFEMTQPSRALWVFRVGQIVIEKELLLRPWGNVAELSYCVRHIPSPVTLRLRPLVALRDFHSLCKESDGPPEHSAIGKGGFALTRDDMKLTLEGYGGSSMERVNEPDWWRNLTYQVDADRGQAFREDLFSPGVYEAKVKRGQADVVVLKATLEHAKRTWPDPPKRMFPGPPLRAATPAEALRAAADQFIASRLDENRWHTTVLAGFPWFADWGRDTMISLPGLLISSGRLDEAQSALKLFARHMRNGLVPNRFDDYGGPPEFNTVDASLWFVHAVHALWKASASLVDDAMRDACRSVLSHYRDGTENNIHMDDDGLIICGGPDTQLTWMDAKRDGVVFTPRHGKPVEIQALWHHALRCASELLDNASEFEALAERAAESLRTKFWWAERKCLHDVLLPGDNPDGRFRPNQLFAVSLEPSPFSKEQQQSIVETAQRYLLTPVGMRTLAPGSDGYIGRFEGDMMQRDRAYHNGTVWPWLIGAFCEALLRAHDFSEDAKDEVRRAIAPLIVELDTGCLGQLAEIYDGDAPHRPAGCPAQAWSVAEVLRVLTLIGAASL